MNNCGNNPCRVTQTNTAACESLPSQISNFADQFFGEVVKTEVDGVVTWSLPCSLDVGLPNNPRAAGEGLACYFLRLFEDGIVGLTGPAGDPGDDGAAGRNAFTVTLASFTQPTVESPNVQVLTQYNPAIFPGLIVAIQSSGWYLVNEADTSGMLFLTLSDPTPGAPAVITAGKLVVPAGGGAVPGPQGPPGPDGGGTVTSVGIAAPSIFSVGPPVTTSGDISVSLAVQSLNTVWAGPSMGSPTTPVFRALVASDIPPLSSFYLPISGGTITGALTAPQVILDHATLTYAATTDIDFDGVADRTLSLTGNVTFTTSNLAVGKTVSIRIICDASTRTFTFPAWRFLGTAPANIAANKLGVLTVKAYGATDADVVAAYAVED